MKEELLNALKVLQEECKRQSSQPQIGNFCTECPIYDYCDNGAHGDWDLKKDYLEKL